MAHWRSPLPFVFLAVVLALTFPTLAAGASVTANVVGGTLTVTGTGAADVVALRLEAGNSNNVQVDVGNNGSAEFTFARATFTQIVVNGLAGPDTLRIDDSNGIFTGAHPTSLNGGHGSDALLGGSGSETLSGGDGDDTLEGNQSSDNTFGGGGADTFIWDPGDSNDTLEGQTGIDRLVFNGSAIGEDFDLSDNGGRLRLTRNIGTVTIDAGGVELVSLAARAGDDDVVVNPLGPTAVTTIDVDFGGADGAADTLTVLGTTGSDTAALLARASQPGVVFDGVTSRAAGAEVPGDMITFDGAAAADTATLTGTSAADVISLVADGTAVAVSADGGATLARATSETIHVLAKGGADTIGTTGNLFSLTNLILDGGKGDDSVSGGNGIDQILGGEGDDTLDGNQHNDNVFGGSGADTFIWDPGDGNDTVEGRAGIDRLVFNGSAIGEDFDLSDNGGRLRLTRNIGTVTIDAGGVELVSLAARAGDDDVVVNPLGATGVTAIDVDFGVADGVADTVTVTGTTGNDTITVAGNSTAVSVTGLSATVGITGHESANDLLTIVRNGGTDSVDSSGLAPNTIQFQVV